jgi:hypothetical protein
MRAASHPLVRAVLHRIIQDESPHARLGWLVLDWAGDRIDKARLAQVAHARIARYAPLWRDKRCPELDPGRRDVAGLMTDREQRDTLTGAVARDIVAPLAARGIHVDVTELLAG